MKTGEARESSLSGGLASLAEMVFDAVVAFDARERITYWNPAAEQLYGWTAQEALGKIPAELFWPTSTSQEKKSRNQRQSRWKRGETLRGKHRACRKDGSSLRVQYATRGTFDSHGKLTGSLAIYREVPIQVLAPRQIEIQLKEVAEKYTTLFDATSDGVWIHNLNGEILEVNDAYCRMSGYSRAELIGMPISVLEVAESPVEIADHIKKVIAAGGHDRFESQHRRKDGSIFDVDITALYLEREGGRIAVFVRDITERKQAAAKLQASRQILETVVNHLPTPVALLRGSDLCLQLINPAYQAIAPGKEMIGRTLDELWTETGQNFTTICRRVLETGEPYQVVDELNMIRRRPDGPLERAYFSWSLYRVQLPGDGGWGLLNTSWETTARKQTEETLRESEERLRQMIETSPVAIGFGDSTGKILSANKAFYRLTGYSCEEIEASQLGWHQLTAPEYAEVDRQILVDLNATGSAGPYEKEYIRKDGSRVPLMLTVSKLPGRDEHIAFIMDITERKRAELAIRESQRKYQDLIETTSDFIWETDSQGRYTYCSPQMETLWGIKPRDMLGKTSFDVMPPEDKEKALESFREMTGSATPFSGLTTTAFNGQGQLFYAETSGVPFFDHEGKLLGFRGITRDVTERNRTRQQIFESNQRLLALMSALPVGVTFSDDPTCRHVTGNPAALAQFEVDSEDNLSASAPDSSAPGRQVQFFREGRRITDADLPLQRSVAENREIAPMELEVRLPSGRRWWASASGAPVCDQNGNVIGGVAVTQDITAHKQVEEQLREQQKQLQLLNETLEQKVQEKTAEVHRLASDVIQAVQHERHRISHILHDDLQQRIYAVQMQLTFLHDELQKENEAARKEVSAAEQQLAEILSVTRHLSIDLSPPILRDEGLAHAINWLAVQMRQGYGLSIELRADEPFAIPDEALHVLLFNCVRELLFNVVKHAQASRAEVSLQWIDPGLRIEVCDDGRGFPVNRSESQAGAEVSLENGGRSGLGLPTIRHQLDLFGGRMEIQSEPGKGACIILTVPITEHG